MKFNELSTGGLKRSFKVVIAGKEIEALVKTELEGLKSKVNLKGFRPGHAPVSLLEKRHGPAVLGQVLENQVKAAAEKVVADTKIQPAEPPSVEELNYEEGSDLEFQLNVFILPKIKLPDLTKIKLERLKAPADKAAVKSIMDGLLAQQKQFEEAPKATKAKIGDAVVIDFIGKIDGKKFEGAEAEDFQLELGSSAFIDGFEDQLVGKEAGDSAVVKVTFPENYNMAEVAGKDAEFDVTVRAVRTRKTLKANDEFAASLGFEHLKQLNESIVKKIEEDNQRVAGLIVKRKLLDILAAENKFEVPDGMVEREYREIWARIRDDMVEAGEIDQEAAKTMEEPADAADRRDFRDIAERRVRLGLLLAEIGRVNEVTVSQEDINQQILFEAKRFPGQEKEVFDYYRGNEQAVHNVRAPVYEDKVCELILATAKVTETVVTSDQLAKAYDALEAEDEAAEDAKQKKPAAKAAKAKPVAKKAVKKKTPVKKSAKKTTQSAKKK